MTTFFSSACEWSSHLTAGITSGAILGLLFWKADDLFSDSGRKLVYARIMATASHPDDPALAAELSTFLGGFYSRKVPAKRFFGFLVGFSVGPMVMVLAFYIAQTPGLLCQLVSDPMASRLFFGQVIGDGLIVLLLSNFFGLLLDQIVFGAAPQFRSSAIYAVLLAEIFVKVIIFILVTAVVYVAYAVYADDFTGSPMRALKAVVPTIRYAIAFGNLTSVYLYATVIFSLPLFIVALIRFMSAHPSFSYFAERSLFFLNFENRPVRTLAVALGVLFALFSIIAYVIIGILSMMAH
jgi:hypothetical protein